MACKRCGKDLRLEICDDKGQIVRDHICRAWFGGAMTDPLLQERFLTMNRTVFEDYKKHCVEGGVWVSPGSFACAFRAAKDHHEPKRPKLEWKNNSRTGGEEVHIKVDGFHVVARMEPSPTNDFIMDDLGKFTDKKPARAYYGGRHSGYEVGAVDRFQGGKKAERNQYRYFVPAMTYEEHYKGLRETGHGKAEADFLARKYVKDAHERAEKVAANEIGEWDLLCTVYKKGVALASGSLGMGDPDGNQSYIDETAWDCIQETVEEAKKKLNELRSDEEESSEEN